MTLPTSPAHGLYYHPGSDTATGNHDVSSINAEWLASLINERHARNWKKIERFVESMKNLGDGSTTPVDDIDDKDDDDDDDDEVVMKASGRTIPRSYDGKRKMMDTFHM